MDGGQTEDTLKFEVEISRLAQLWHTFHTILGCLQKWEKKQPRQDVHLDTVIKYFNTEIFTKLWHPQNKLTKNYLAKS